MVIRFPLRGIELPTSDRKCLQNREAYDLSEQGTGGSVGAERIYMDHAATSWPKSTAAVDAAFEFLHDCGATAGRGSYSSARQADQWIDRARTSIAKLIGAAQASEIAFTSSGTHALNAVLCGLLREGEHVLTTALEHNSVLRPLHRLSSARSFDYSVLPAGTSGLADPAMVPAAVKSNSRYLVLGHASNVTGAVHDLNEWSRAARDHGLELILDASQTVGYLPLDLQQYEIAALASAGHKGLRAMPGTGFVCVRKDLADGFLPQMLGGTGRSSESVQQMPGWPQSIEVGNLNLPAIVSMAVAGEELNAVPSESLCARWAPAFSRLLTGLREIEGIDVIGHSSGNGESGGTEFDFERIPVVSVAADGWDPHDLATVLDAEFGIEARAGLHCAALIHAHLGTSESSGTLRLSTGVSTTNREVDRVLEALRTVVGT
ncbi:MAG: aminotransferase class V-fold PLP-dependent enzyme [Aureliella sp.]